METDMLGYLGLGAVILIVAVVALLAYAATRPDDFRVSRSATVKADPQRVFFLIADMRAFNEWNPFVKQDPGMEIGFSGPQSGLGAAQSFEGGNGGKGRLEVTGATEPTLVVMSLDMEKPIVAHNVVTFDLRREGEATTVTWTMSGGMSLIAKVMGIFFDMDREIGQTFERGLADLKMLAESQGGGLPGD